VAVACDAVVAMADVALVLDGVYRAIGADANCSRISAYLISTRRPGRHFPVASGLPMVSRRAGGLPDAVSFSATS
jgi:hypothetical protein